MKVYEKIKKYRIDKNYSQESVAYELGLSQSQYSRRENGQIVFNIDEILKLVDVFDISLNDLFEDFVEKKSDFGNTPSKDDAREVVLVPRKLIELYELRIKEKAEMIKILLSK